jgi:hypothetical protein
MSVHRLRGGMKETTAYDDDDFFELLFFILYFSLLLFLSLHLSPSPFGLSLSLPYHSPAVGVNAAAGLLPLCTRLYIQVSEPHELPMHS